jgi:hypothetical protein
MTAAVETPPDVCFSDTIKESTDGAETLEEDTRRNIGDDQQLGPVSPKRRTKTGRHKGWKRKHKAQGRAGCDGADVLVSMPSRKEMTSTDTIIGNRSTRLVRALKGPCLVLIIE